MADRQQMTSNVNNGNAGIVRSDSERASDYAGAAGSEDTSAGTNGEHEWSALPADAPAALGAIAAKATRPDPAGRYPDVMAMLADIERFQNGLAVEAWSEPLSHRLRRFGSRNAVLLWLLAAFAGVKFLLFFLRNL